MRIVTAFYDLDVFFLTRIFHLNKRAFLNSIIPIISHSGDGYFYVIIPFLVYFIEPAKALPLFLALVASFTVELTIYKLFKNVLKRSRPYEILDEVEHRMVPSDQFSFPSGHTGGAFLVATLLHQVFPSMVFIFYFWALAVGFSRVYLGLHFPSDVLAGALLGRLCALIGLGLFLA